MPFLFLQDAFSFQFYNFNLFHHFSNCKKKCCENLVNHKFSENLYQKLQGELEEHVAKEAKRLCGEISNKSFLGLISQAWDSHTKQMVLIRQLHIPLDGSYALKSSNTVKSIWNLGLELFKVKVVENRLVQPVLMDSLLREVKREREGDAIERLLVKNLLRMLFLLQLYEETFEARFLEESRHFYRLESREKIEKLPLPEYLSYIESKRNEESERVLHYLEPKTKKPLLLITEEQLIGCHTEELLLKGFEELIDRNQIEQLSLLFKLFSKVNATLSLNTAFGSYVKRVGLEMLNLPEKEDSLVKELLLLKDKLNDIVSKSFNSEPAFKETLRVTFNFLKKFAFQLLPFQKVVFQPLYQREGQQDCRVACIGDGRVSESGEQVGE